MTDRRWAEVWKVYCDLRETSGGTRTAALLSLPDGVREEVQELLDQSDVVSQLSQALPAKRAPEYQPGTEIGRYVITGLIGEGGFGRVYSAHDKDLRRSVAIKILSAEGGGKGKGVVEEARLASALNHPNILTIHETVEIGGHPAMVMEFVPGRSLRRELAESKGPLPLGTAIGYATQIVRALGAAHSAGIVHRDVKPENILVRPDGYLKLVDFGLASARIATDVLSWQPFHGTLRYTSPEQLKGTASSPSSDIFALGLVLYEMVTGVHPFRKATPLETAGAIASVKPLPPNRQAKGIPVELNQLILSMLEKDPALRPAASAVMQALAKVSVHSGRSHWMWASAGLVIAMAGIAIWILSIRTPLQPSLRQITTTVPENHVTAAAVAPGGGRVAHAELGGNLLVTDLKTGDARMLPAPQKASIGAISWFPVDDTLLLSAETAFPRAPELWISSPAGTRLVRAGARRGMVSPDGQQIAFASADESEIWVMGSGGHAARRLVAGSQTEFFLLLGWAPDGRHLWYSRRGATSDPSARREGPDDLAKFSHNLEAVDLTGRLTAELPIAVTGACISADGRMLLLRPEQEQLHDFNLWEARVSSGALIGSPRRVTNWKDKFIRSLTCSREGTFTGLLIQVSQSDIFVGDLEPSLNAFKSVRRVTFDEKSEYPHAWTPDSRAVIFEKKGPGGWDLFTQRIDDRLAQPLSKGEISEIMAQISADNRWVLFTAFPEDGSAIQLSQRLMRVPLGGGNAERVPVERYDEFRCAITPGHLCVLRTVENREYVYSALDPIHGRGKELARTAWSPGILGDWALSADGREVAIPNHDPREAKILLVHLAVDHGEVSATKELPVPGLTGLRGMHAAKQGGWFASASLPKGVRLVYIDPRGRYTLLHESPVLTWGVPSPDGRSLAFFDQALQSNVWSMDRF